MHSGWKVKINLNGWRSLMMVHLRPYKYSQNGSITKAIEWLSFSIWVYISRIHLRHRIKILLDVTLVFPMSYDFVRVVLLILNNLYLFLISMTQSKFIDFFCGFCDVLKTTYFSKVPQVVQQYLKFAIFETNLPK